MTDQFPAKHGGLAQKVAHNMKQRGFAYAFSLPVRQARPQLPIDATFVATPVDDEGVMIYSFRTEDGAKAFREIMPDAKVI